MRGARIQMRAEWRLSVSAAFMLESTMTSLCSAGFESDRARVMQQEPFR